MRQWLVLVLALGAAGACSTPGAGARGAEGDTGAAAVAARADSAARRAAATAAVAERPRIYVDVRTPEEFTAGHLAGAINIPLSEIEQRWAELKAYPDAQIVLYCRSGKRAGAALAIVTGHGITNASNGGGLEDLRKQVEAGR